MARNFPVTAHLKTDIKKYQDNFDRIDWGTRKEEPWPSEEGMNEECSQICAESKDLSFLKFGARVSLARMD